MSGAVNYVPESTDESFEIIFKIEDRQNLIDYYRQKLKIEPYSKQATVAKLRLTGGCREKYGLP